MYWKKNTTFDTKADRKTEPQYDIDKGTIRCDNCSENGSYKCSKCDGEIYFKRLEVEDEPTISKMEQVEDEPQTDCLTCRYNSDEWDSPKCDGCSKADSHYEPQSDCAWK